MWLRACCFDTTSSCGFKCLTSCVTSRAGLRGHSALFFHLLTVASRSQSFSFRNVPTLQTIKKCLWSNVQKDWQQTFCLPRLTFHHWGKSCQQTTTRLLLPPPHSSFPQPIFSFYLAANNKKVFVDKHSEMLTANILFTTINVSSLRAILFANHDLRRSQPLAFPLFLHALHFSFNLNLLQVSGAVSILLLWPPRDKIYNLCS